MRWFALAAVLAGLSLPGSTGGAATLTGKVAFDSDRTGTWVVYLANPDGTGVRPVAPGYYPTWSADGSKLAFTDGDSVFVAAGDGTGTRSVAHGYDAVWSPDGTRLAVVNRAAISVVNADGTGTHQLTSVNSSDAATLSGLPAWSPDGTRLAFERLSGLFVMNADGTGLKQLSTWGVDGSSIAHPQWSPDGRSLAYVESVCCVQGDVGGYEFQTKDPALKVVDVATGTARQIASEVEDVAAWSPDGTRIAYAQTVGTAETAPSEIFVAPVAGGPATQVSVSTAGESSWAPAWSPDGQAIVYMHGRFPERFYSYSADLAVVGADGSSPAQLTQPFPTGGSDEDPVWAAGTLSPVTEREPEPVTTLTRHGLTGSSIFFEVAASGPHAAVITGDDPAPLLWEPPATRLRHGRAPDDETDYYGVTMTNDYAAWFSASAHGVVDPVTDVTLVLTNRLTGKSAEVTTIERAGHNPPYETGPRLVGDGSLLVYNPNARGSKLFRVDTSSPKPRLRLLATNVAAADVNGGRIAGWRGSNVVTLDAKGHVLGTAALDRRAATSVRLEGNRLYATTAGLLSRLTLNGKLERSWPLVDEGGEAATLVGVQGDIAVYRSGIAVHVLRLSTGHDIVLDLPGEVQPLDLELTTGGLFYAYNTVLSGRPGHLGRIVPSDLAKAA